MNLDGSKKLIEQITKANDITAEQFRQFTNFTIDELINLGYNDLLFSKLGEIIKSGETEGLCKRIEMSELKHYAVKLLIPLGGDNFISMVKDGHVKFEHRDIIETSLARWLKIEKAFAIKALITLIDAAVSPERLSYLLKLKWNLNHLGIHDRIKILTSISKKDFLICDSFNGLTVSQCIDGERLITDISRIKHQPSRSILLLELLNSSKLFMKMILEKNINTFSKVLYHNGEDVMLRILYDFKINKEQLADICNFAYCAPSGRLKDIIIGYLYNIHSAICLAKDIPKLADDIISMIHGLKMFLLGLDNKNIEVSNGLLSIYSNAHVNTDYEFQPYIV